MTDLELLIQEWDNRLCKACGEGKLKVSQRDIPLTYLQVYTIMVPTSFPKCDVCGAACLPRISHKILKFNKKKVIERVFYN